VLRNHQKVLCGAAGEGEITSGSFSPTLNQAVALARVPSAVKIGDRLTVDLRGKPAAVRVVKYPFVRNGKSCLS
jgi:aminomethyltransferase